MGQFIFQSISAEKCANESMKIMEDFYKNCRKVVEKDFPISTMHNSRNMMESFEVYISRLGYLANYENSSSLADSAGMMLSTLRVLETVNDSPETMLI